MCDPAEGFTLECPAPDEDKEFALGPDIVAAYPFVVRSSLTCSPVGLTEERLRQFLMQRLVASEQSEVEQIFSAGLNGAAPTLSNNTPAASSAGASAAGITQAVAQLETWLYTTQQYGPNGVLHVPTIAAAYFNTSGIMRWDAATRTWRTNLGTKISFGNYTGEGPAGEDPAAGTTYIYITGDTTVWRAPDSEVFVTPLEMALDRTTNQVRAQAEREYAVAFECFSAYSLTTLWT